MERREKVIQIIKCQKFAIFIPVARTWDKVERRVEERISEVEGLNMAAGSWRGFEREDQ